MDGHVFELYYDYVTRYPKNIVDLKYKRYIRYPATVVHGIAVQQPHHLYVYRSLETHREQTKGVNLVTKNICPA